jgi:phospholipid-binding lipoprotein MlaA
MTLALLALAVVNVGCATSGAAPSEQSDQFYDPWEPMNRHIYRFNANFDKNLFMPLVRGYRFVMPQIARTGLSNFFSNIGELTNIVNSFLQVSPAKTVKSLGRFTVNSTVGIGGLLDVAQHWNLHEHPEDFGQTLGFYGVGPGPYFVLPILGPSSLRDAGGIVVDKAMISVPLMIWAPSVSPYHTGGSVLGAIQTRDDLGFHYGELGPFEYNLIRGLYLEARKLQVED